MPRSLRANNLQKAIDENNNLYDKSFKTLDVNANVMVIRDGQESHPRRKAVIQLFIIIIHQTHCEKSDWSRAFNQFTIACELDMINAISAADIAFIMSSSTSAWLLSPLECSLQKQNG